MTGLLAFHMQGCQDFVMNVGDYLARTEEVGGHGELITRACSSSVHVFLKSVDCGYLWSYQS